MLNFGGKRNFHKTHTHAFNSRRWRLCYCSHQGLVWNWQVAGLWW